MDDPDIHEDTADDPERFEQELLAQDRDHSRSVRDDLTYEEIQQLVDDLIANRVVRPIPETQTFVHLPSGTVFRSAHQLVLFHAGWTAAMGNTGTSSGE